MIPEFKTEFFELSLSQKFDIHKIHTDIDKADIAELRSYFKEFVTFHFQQVQVYKRLIQSLQTPTSSTND